MNYEDVYKMDPVVLIQWLRNTCVVPMPSSIETPEDMQLASELMLKLSNSHVYLLELLSYGKIMVRRAKRELPKEEYEDMIDRQNAVQNAFDMVKQQYAVLSRAVTIKSERNRELQMEGCF